MCKFVYLSKVQKVLKMLLHDPETKLLVENWTITELVKGYDFIREVDLIA